MNKKENELIIKFIYPESMPKHGQQCHAWGDLTHRSTLSAPLMESLVLMLGKES